MQTDLFEAPPAWSAPTEYPILSGIVGLDTETRDPRLTEHGPGWIPGGDGEIIGFSLAWEGGANYWPLRHRGGGNVPDAAQTLSWLRSQLERPELTWVAHHSGYDLGWLYRELGIFPAGDVEDTWIAGFLLDETRPSFSLDRLASAELGTPKDERGLLMGARVLGVKPKEVKANLWRLPANYVGPYATGDAILARQLWLEKFSAGISADGLTRVYELERELARTLVKVRGRGVPVDQEQMARSRTTVYQRRTAALDEVKRITGLRVEPWVPESLAQAFNARGIPLPKTPTGLPSVTSDWLEACQDPIAEHIRIARKVDKLQQFLDGIERNTLNSHVYPSINQLRDDDGGTITARFSYSDPNLQQMPARDEESAQLIRTVFAAEVESREKKTKAWWAANDFSQQEPRLLVHFASLVNARGADVFVSRYRENAATDFYQVTVDLTGLPRKQAKVIGLGIPYGMGEAKLCHSLGFPTFFSEEGYEKAGPEGRAVLDNFDRELPFVRELQKMATRLAKQRGYVKTLLGGRARFPLKGGERWWTHKALNRLIQRSAAEQTKAAMVAIERENGDAGEVLLQVHDELGTRVWEPRQVTRGRELMCDTVPLAVPSKVDTEIGPSWGAASAEGYEKFMAGT